MNKFTNLSRLLGPLFDQERFLKKASLIVEAYLRSGCLRLSRIAEQMPGKAVSNYKTIQRFLAEVDLKAALRRLFQEEAEFVIGDPTEIERPQAKRTEYVGRLSDGDKLGFWVLLLATPFRGRAIPFDFITYSSSTIGQEATSRNLEHFRAFHEIQPLVGERPIVLDREFSYLELLEAMAVEKVHFVIRLKVGLPQVGLSDGEGNLIKLVPPFEKPVIYRDIYYKGRVKVNLIGITREGFQTPLWVMTDLEPERALEIYLKRMKIEESFRDCKALLGMDQVMNKLRTSMEQMISLALLAYGVGLFMGEALRDVAYGDLAPEEITYEDLLSPSHAVRSSPKWGTYSGLFVLLRIRLPIPEKTARALLRPVSQAFAMLVSGNVRTFV